MSTPHVTLDAAVYAEMQQKLAALQQRVSELEYADRDRRQAEIALRQSEELFRATFEQAAIGINFMSLSGRFTHFNQRWCELVGYDEEELWELTTQDITHADDAMIELELTERLLSNKIPSYSLEKRYIRPDRSLVWVHLTASLIHSPTGEPRYILSIVQDISERKRSEDERKQAEAERRKVEQALQQKAQDLETALRELQQTQTHLVQSEKMSSLGQLVAGVAHEINNPVNFIYGNLNYANDYIQDLLGLLQLYQEHCPIPPSAVQGMIDAIDLEFLIDDLPKLLASMRVGAERIREIIASLRNFSRLDEAEFKTVDVHEGIDSTLMILQNRLKAQSSAPGIQVVKDYGDLPPVKCYPGQLNQVFMNILTNAIDALDDQMRQSDAFIPMIQIHTTKVDTDHIAISIQDNGPGILPEVRDRLFDPFFTTKPIGKGTGLGMSISYRIVVEKHNGTLKCQSEPGQGAEFIVTIPIRQVGIAE